MVIDGTFRKSDRAVLVNRMEVDVRQPKTVIRVADGYYEVLTEDVVQCTKSNDRYVIPFHKLRPAIGG